MVDRILFVVGYPLWIFIITVSWIVGKALRQTGSWVDYYRFFKEITLNK